MSAVPASPPDEYYELSDIDQADLSTLQAKTIGAGALSREDDGEDEDDLELGRQQPLQSFLSFFAHGTGAVFLGLAAVAVLTGAVGGAGYSAGLTEPLLGGVVSLWLLLLLVAVFVASLAVIRITLHIVLRAASLISPWNWIHHANVLESHIAMLVWLVAWIVLSSLYTSEVTLDATVKPMLLKCLLGPLVMVVCLAVKSHHMRNLAMSFSFANYRDRIEAALETDRVLQLLWRSRHTYKFRKRVVKSARAPAAAGLGAGGSYRPSVSVDSAHAAGAAAEPPKKATVKTEAEKKANFVQFSKLAARTMGVVSGTGDFRLENAKEARRQASKLYKYMRASERPYLVPQDLRCYLEAEADAQLLLGLLRRHIKWQHVGPQSEDVVFGERQLRKLIQAHLNEIVMIVKSMQSIETALYKVDWIFATAIVMVVGLGYAIVFGGAVQLLVAMAGFLSAAAFVFSTTARNAFESLVFILLVHPFDVGDRVFINLNTFSVPVASTIPVTMSGSDALDNLLVVEMHLLSTVFERWDGVRLFVPNYVLAMKPVYNVRRSGPLIEMQRIQISFDTPIHLIDELRCRLDRFVRADRTDFTDLSRVNFDAVESCNRLHLNVIAQYTGNWQDLDKQLAFRTRFLMFIKQTLEDLSISYLPPVQRVSLVNRDGRPMELPSG